MQVDATTGYLSQVDGSTLYKTSSTTLICSVTGPIEPKARQELSTELALELTVRPATGVPSTREVAIQDKINSVLNAIVVGHVYPRQLAQVTFQILEAGEDTARFSAKETVSCINAATLALMDAGIAMRALALGAVIAVDTCGAIVLDPTNEQMENAQSIHALVLELINGGKTVNNILLLDSNGDFKEQTLFNVLETGEQYIITLAKKTRSIIEQKINNDMLI